MDEHRHTVTQILAAAPSAGEAAEQLFPVLYGELRRLGAALLYKERPGHTLSTTELVHEAYLRLFDAKSVPWSNRRHFFGAAATAMRRILVDRARSRGANKRIPKEQLDELRQSMVSLDGDNKDDVLAIDAALERLAEVDPRRVQIVELRYFVGLTEEETAEVLGVSRATVARDWRGARRWLLAELS